MAKVACTVEETTITNDNNVDIESVEATCTLCGNQGQAFGTHEGSVTRALMQIKETCPRKGAKNFYFAKET